MLNSAKYINILLLLFFAVMLVFVVLTNKLYNDYQANQLKLEQTSATVDKF